MIYKLKGRKYYRVKFQFAGRPIHKCTRATDARTARSIEVKLRSELARGNWGILELKAIPTLSEFLKEDFLPFTRVRFTTKLKTRQYYEYGADRLLTSDLAELRLNQINGQHATQFAARYRGLSPSTINCGLRTLRRALSHLLSPRSMSRVPRVPGLPGVTL